MIFKIPNVMRCVSVNTKRCHPSIYWPKFWLYVLIIILAFLRSTDGGRELPTTSEAGEAACNNGDNPEFLCHRAGNSPSYSPKIICQREGYTYRYNIVDILVIARSRVAYYLPLTLALNTLWRCHIWGGWTYKNIY